VQAVTGVRIYFADPHSPWQRGSNENTNGLLRQYLPKATDLSPWNSRQLKAIADELNDRPRAILGDRSPTQVMRRLGHQTPRPVIRNDG
jgi:IS30 family transposase